MSDDEYGSFSDDSELLALVDSQAETETSAKRKAVDSARPTSQHADSQAPLSMPKRAKYDTVALANRILRDHFGLAGFRSKQEQAITRLLDGDSAVVVFPTGAGKSLCYQVPALAFPILDQISGGRDASDGGITLVISPLLALMKDQVDALKKRSISAERLDSTKSRDEFLAIMDLLRSGGLRILYCAPERLNNEGFVATLKGIRGGVRMVAVDEAHCISEWGHAFRPDYLKVARFVQEIHAERVVCLTATATDRVARDVCKAFGVDEEHGLFRTPIYRPNLSLHAKVTEKRQDKYALLLSWLKKHKGPTIIYVTLQKQAEQLASDLRNNGFPSVESFHAGMQTEQKTLIQERFMDLDNMIICATIAFGMGIDKANIRNVIHFDIPRSIEGYSQQIGRAGRDGLPSNCVIYISNEDFYLQSNLTYGDLPSRNSLNSLLEEIYSFGAGLKIGDTFNVSHYQQSNAFDIRTSPLAIIYARLELYFGLIRAMTPEYSLYQYEVKQMGRYQGDKTPSAVTIRNASKKAVKWYHLDIKEATKSGTINRSDLLQKINQWNDSGIINLKTSGLSNVYRLDKPFPTTAAEKAVIANRLYSDMQLREQQDLDRVQQVVALFTKPKCYAQSMTDYFEDTTTSTLAETPDTTDRAFDSGGVLPTTGCGHCTYCTTHETTVLPPRLTIEMDWNAVERVLQAVPDRDDALFLARVAFGIKSPRISKGKWDKHAVFSSMADQDFMELVRVFGFKCSAGVAEGRGK